MRQGWFFLAFILALAPGALAEPFSEALIQDAVARARGIQILPQNPIGPVDPCRIAALDSAVDYDWASDRVPAAEAPVDRMTRHLVAMNGLESLWICPTMVMRNQAINAVAWQRKWAGKTVRFVETTTGMLSKLRSDEELAAVLAHELAHHYLRHDYGMRVLDSAAKGLPPVWRELWLAKETRLVEREADFLAAFFMARAGYDPRGLVSLQRLLKAEAGFWTFATPLDTHPRASDRIRLAEELAKSAQRVAPKRGEPVPALADLRALGY